MTNKQLATGFGEGRGTYQPGPTTDDWLNVVDLTRGFCGGIPGPAYQHEPRYERSASRPKLPELDVLVPSGAKSET